MLTTLAFVKKKYFCPFKSLNTIIMNEQDINMSFFRFEDLRIYAKAMDYITWLYEGVASFSPICDEKNIGLLKDSFFKSANAIALNTAEGSSRNKTQFLYYLKMAKSSVRECVVYTETAYRLQLLSEEAKDYSRMQLMELTKMIGSLIASLQRSAGVSLRSDKEDDMLDPISDIDNL